MEGASKPNLTLNRIVNPEYRSWLDFGCGWGALVQAARLRGYDARGIEVGELARSSLIQRGLAVYADLSECRAAGFHPDVVSLIHSLEHLADPRALLREIHSLMSPQGSLVIEVPNLKSLRARAGVLFPKNRYPNAQAYYAFPIHLVYYTMDSLCRLLESSGFKIGSTGAHGFGLEIFEVPLKTGETRQQPPPSTLGQPKRLQFLRKATKEILSRFYLGEHIYVVAWP
jgi:SAM-dependent methyltransferase